MSKIQIRRVLEDESESLSEIASSTFIATYTAIHPENKDLLTAYTQQTLSPTHIRQYLQNPRVQYYFIEVDEVVAGYTKLILGSDDDPSAELEKFYILEAFKHQGLGQRLFDFVRDLARASGQTSLKLSVYELNHGALRFYTKNGFKVLGKKDFVFSFNGSEYRDTDWLMVLPFSV